MNYVNFIVKILEKPEQSRINDEIYVTKFIARYPRLQNQKIETLVKIIIWGNSSEDISKYFFVGDYIIIEGYISLADSTFNYRNSVNEKQIEISVFKIYPFLFY